MGDRANLQLNYNTDDEPSRYPNLFLYTHWGGYDLPHNLQSALVKAKPRWDDETYCARILVSQIIGIDWNSETGYGLSPYITDNQHPDLIVNLMDQTITLNDHPPITYAQYCLLTEAQITKLWTGHDDEEDGEES